MSSIKGLAHAFHPSMLLIILDISEKILLVVAELIGN